jgi:hypothetical protein
MRLAVLLGTTVALAACATTRTSPSWLVGTWLMMEPDVEFPLACASGLPIIYHADGTYDLMEGGGTWRLAGARLIETAQVNDAADSGPPDLGRAYVAEIERLGPDAFRKTYADGAVETFRRCPPGP